MVCVDVNSTQCPRRQYILILYFPDNKVLLKYICPAFTFTVFTLFYLIVLTPLHLTKLRINRLDDSIDFNFSSHEWIKQLTFHFVISTRFFLKPFTF